MSIGGKVKKYREGKGYSQEKLANVAEVAQTTISRIESDRSIPNALLLYKIAEALQVEMEELLDFDKTTSNHIQQKECFPGDARDYTHNNTIHTLSKKVIEQFEVRLREKDETIALLKKRLF